jgi:hypothetical protein
MGQIQLQANSAHLLNSPENCACVALGLSSYSSKLLCQMSNDGDFGRPHRLENVLRQCRLAEGEDLVFRWQGAWLLRCSIELPSMVSDSSVHSQIAVAEAKPLTLI